jgi:hypothetical protein
LDSWNRSTATARVVRWSVLVALGLWLGYLMGDQDVGLAIVFAGYLLSWQRWPDRTRARRRG